MSTERYVALMFDEQDRYRKAEQARARGITSEAKIDEYVSTKRLLAKRAAKFKTRQAQEMKDEIFDALGRRPNYFDDEY